MLLFQGAHNLMYTEATAIVSSSPMAHQSPVMYAAMGSHPISGLETVENMRQIAPTLHNPNCPVLSNMSQNLFQSQPPNLINFPSNVIPPPPNLRDDYLGHTPHIISSTSLHNIHVAHLEFPLNIPTPEPFRDTVIACYGTLERRKTNKQCKSPYNQSCESFNIVQDDKNNSNRQESTV